MGRTLWLHIGSHKTGSTSIQHALWAAQRKRDLGSLTYIHTANTKSTRSLVKLTGEGETFKARLKHGAVETLVPPNGDCIFSSELLFFLHRRSLIAELRNALEQHFDRINVVAYLRRQDRLALSHRKQVVKGLPAARFYGVQVSALPSYRPYLHNYFDYNVKIRMWMDVFGAENVTVRRFDKISLADSDSVADFFTLIGKLAPKTSFKSNKAMCRRHLLVGLWLRSEGVESEVIEKLISKVPQDEALLPSEAQAAEFLEPFAASNRELAVLLGESEHESYFDHDLSSYPEAGNDVLTSADIRPIEGKLRKMGLIPAGMKQFITV